MISDSNVSASVHDDVGFQGIAYREVARSKLLVRILGVVTLTSSKCIPSEFQRLQSKFQGHPEYILPCS